MNILLVHNYYKIAGGEDTVFESEKSMLEKHGHKVITYTRNNKELDDLGPAKKLFTAIHSDFSKQVYSEISSLIKKHEIDIVHVHNTLTMITPAVYYAAVDNNIPVVQTMHNFRLFCINALLYKNDQICEDCISKGSPSPGVKNRCYHDSLFQSEICARILNRNRKKGIYRKINYICLTEFNKEKLIEGMKDNIDPTKIFIKPNFVPDRYEELKSEPVLADKLIPQFSASSGSSIKGSYYLYAGRLDISKGILDLVKEWPDDPNLPLIICGDGQIRNELETQTKNVSNIFILGHKDHAETLNLIYNAEALIFPSRLYETFGMVIAEAYMCGTPVISGNIGNGADLVRSATPDLLTEIKKEHLQALLTDTLKKDNSEKCRQYYLDHFTEEKNYEILSSIYSSIF
ncbi:Glycosyltransferase involved in cell wall bisynthesis [Lachnospiraceae bacterium XPB1003]|nr:Glycosyltransferase involved in cell wall bisynthesis [Lachnospiraceae bacterium XPB1003]